MSDEPRSEEKVVYETPAIEDRTPLPMPLVATDGGPVSGLRVDGI